MKKLLLALIVTVIGMMMACAHAAATPAQPLEKLTVMLDWFPNPDHAPLLVAQQQGFFKEQGLEVQLLEPVRSNDPATWVTQGKADIGISYEPEYIEQIDRGLPLVRVGTLIDKPLGCIVALKSSGIHSLADLKGKRIGRDADGLSNIFLKVVLAKAGLTEKDVQLVNLSTNPTQALLSHQVDVVTGMMRNFSVPMLEAQGYNLVTFFPEEHGIPNYSVLIFTTNLAKAHDARLPRFLSAIKKAVAYLDQHPQQTWQQFAKQYPEANNELNREAWFATLPYFAENPAAFNGKASLQFAEFMQHHQLIKKVQPLSRYAVTLKG